MIVVVPKLFWNQNVSLGTLSPHGLRCLDRLLLTSLAVIRIGNENVLCTREIATDGLCDRSEVKGIETNDYGLPEISEVARACGVTFHIVDRVRGSHVVGIDHEERALLPGSG